MVLVIAGQTNSHISNLSIGIGLFVDWIQTSGPTLYWNSAVITFFSLLTLVLVGPRNEFEIDYMY